MIKRYILFLLAIVLVSCAPTSRLSMDILNSAEFTFSDTGKVIVLNASYLPSAMHNKSNLISILPPKEKVIFDTLITANLLNGFFSILNDSPIRSLRNAEYQEIRTIDTTNFLFPLSGMSVIEICNNHNARFLIALEYYGFNVKDSSFISDECGWATSLEVSNQLVWRIYSSNGELIDQKADLDTLFWISNSCTDLSVPELTDAVREIFYLAGEKFGKRISPYWSVISRYYYLIFHSGDDISLDQDQLVILKSSKNPKLAFKACYNLAVLSESEDNLPEAIKWLEEAKAIKKSEVADIYIRKLENRLISREKLDLQSGYN